MLPESGTTDGAGDPAAHAAERAYAAIDADDRPQARELLLRLVGQSGDGSVYRRWLPLADLVDADQSESLGRALGALLAERVVVFNGDGVEIADGLQHRWPRLADWLAEPTPARPAPAPGDRASDADLDTPPTASPAPGRQLKKRHSRLWRRRAMVLGACALLVAGATVGVVLLTGGQSGPPTSASARANTLAADAETARSTDPGLAAQLAIAAYHTSATEDAANELYRTLNTPLDGELATMTKNVLQVTAASRGSLAAAVDQSGLTQIWDLANPAKPALDATIHTGAMAIALDPHGKLLAADCGGNKGLCLWNLADPHRPTVLARLPKPATVPTKISGVTSMAFSPDGAMLAAALESGLVPVWSVARPMSPQPLATLQDPSQQAATLAAVAFGPDGLLANTIIAGSTQLWRLSTATAPTKLATIDTGYQSIALSPDGSQLAAASDTTIGLWNIANPTNPAATTVDNNQLPNFETEDLHAVAFSPDGSHLAIGAADTSNANGLVCTFALTSTYLTNSTGPTPDCATTSFGISAAVYLPTAGLLTAGFDTVVRLWRQPLQEVEAAQPIARQQWDFSPNEHLFTAPVAPTSDMQTSAAVGIWDLSSPGPATLDGTLPVANVYSDFFLTNNIDVTVDDNGAVQLWDLSDPQHPTQALTLGTAKWVAPLPVAASVSFAGDLVAVFGNDGQLHLWRVKDAQHATEISSIRPPATATGPGEIMPDGHTVLFFTPTGIDWWDVSDPTRPKAGGVSLFAQPQTVQFAGDGSLFGVSTAPGNTSHVARLQLFALSNGWPQASTTVATAVGNNFILDSGGRLLAATGVGDTTVSLWDISNPGQPHLLGTITTLQNIQGISLDKRNGRMADWNTDTVELWDIHNPAAPTRLATITPGGKPNTTIVSSAGLSPTGATLATVLEDSVQLLDADPGALANRLCSFTGRAITPQQWQRYASSVPYQQPCP